MPDPDLNTATVTPPKKMAFAAFLPLIETAVGGVLSLFGKNAEVDKAKSDLEVAKNNLAIAKTAVDISKEGTKQELIKLAEAKEVTAQKALEEQTKAAKSKNNVGLITIGIVLVFIFGIGWLFVKFVLPMFSTKSEPTQIVVQET